MKLYVLVAARYARLQAIKNIIDLTISQMAGNDNRINQSVREELQRSCQAPIVAIRNAVAGNQLPQLNMVQQLRNAVTAIEGRFRNAWGDRPVARQEVILTKLREMIRNLQTVEGLLNRSYAQQQWLPQNYEQQISSLLNIVLSNYDELLNH